MPKKYFTTREAAARIGVSRQTLYSWIDSKLIDAPKPLLLGGGSVRMWTAEDIEHAAGAKGKLKPGPVPKKRKAGAR
jgi:excisionase family DNA binding protein